MRIPRSARYVVIGAGIHGLSTGWHLAMELERRMAYLHARPGRVAAVRESCTRQLGSVAEWLEPADAFARGLFGPGPVSPAARRRVGDLILLARDDCQFVYPFTPRKKPPIFAGNHGALDPREMLVPLLALRL